MWTFLYKVWCICLNLTLKCTDYFTCVLKRACSSVCFSIVLVSDPHSIFSNLVNMCLFMAVTEYSILMQYWVGYDLHILSSSSNDSPSSVSTDLYLTPTLLPLAIHFNSTMKSSHEKSLFSALTKGPKIANPDCCGGIFHSFPVKCIQSLKPHWSPPSFPNSQMWDRRRGLTAGQG